MLITISRQYGAGGSAVAARVAATLGWRVVDNELVERVAARAGLTPEDVAQREERVSTFIERLARTVVAATPELVVPPDAAGTAATLSEADLVRLTDRDEGGFRPRQAGTSSGSANSYGSLWNSRPRKPQSRLRS